MSAKHPISDKLPVRVNPSRPSLLRRVAQACKEFDLLAEGDRVAVALSGGKDSTSLLDLLLQYRERAGISYEVIAVHVVGAAAGLPDPTDILAPWLEARGVEYRFAPLELPPGEPLPMDCFRCSWNRRKALFLAADALGCNKLAFGHHADDAAVTTLMNLLFTGRLETMEPKVSFFGGRVTVIRPLIYVPAKDLAAYARASGFPLVPPCPYRPHDQRRRIAEFLRGFGGRQQAIIRANLWRAARAAKAASAPAPTDGKI
ncbi:MAG: tRNA 2-thiocytidine biosynthesis TtcA family protein [Anaerolineae bacterium]